MLEIIKKRKSTVLFDEKKISQEIFFDLFEAARWAPSSRNTQPWRFIYASKGDSYYSNMLDCLIETNKVWARNAPVLLVMVAEIISDYKNKRNIYAWHDTAMAYAYLSLYATEKGLSLHPMGGFDRDQATKVLDIPNGYEVVAFSALGYKSSSTDFPQELLNRENSRRERKDLSEIVFNGKFGNAY